MKTKSSFTAFTLKVLVVITFITVGFAGFCKCDAQSIVGKWHRGGTKIFVTDKTNGTQTPVSAQQQKQFDDQLSKMDMTKHLNLNQTILI